MPSLVVFSLMNDGFLGISKGKTPNFAKNPVTKRMPRHNTRRVDFEIPRVPTCIAVQIASASWRGNAPDALKRADKTRGTRKIDENICFIRSRNFSPLNLPIGFPFPMFVENNRSFNLWSFLPGCMFSVISSRALVSTQLKLLRGSWHNMEFYVSLYVPSKDPRAIVVAHSRAISRMDSSWFCSQQSLKSFPISIQSVSILLAIDTTVTLFSNGLSFSCWPTIPA